MVRILTIDKLLCMCLRHYIFTCILQGVGEDLILVRDDRFKTLEVEKECELKTFIQDQNLAFQRGAAFYEFTRAEEDIVFRKEVILMDKVLINYACRKYIIIVMKDLPHPSSSLITAGQKYTQHNW